MADSSLPRLTAQVDSNGRSGSQRPQTGASASKLPLAGAVALAGGRLRPAGVPGLLVSVRDLQELSAIAATGVDVIDFKEPRRGALAAADPQLWQQAAAQCPPHCRLSSALGEWAGAAQLASFVPARFAFAKAGPAGAGTTARLIDAWAAIRAALSPETELVAVAYADHQLATCPAPEAIFGAAGQAGMRTWLLDTMDKSPGCSSIIQLGTARLHELSRLAEQYRALWVLAGSITWQAADELLRGGLRPGMFGVRGDVCERSRGGRIVPAKVTHWLDLLRSFSHDVD